MDDIFKAVFQALGSRRVIPPVPQGRVAVPTDTEPDEQVDQPDNASSTSCFIEYTNSKGEDSSRSITIVRISGHYGQPETLGAHCHAQERYKNFRVDRIQTMCDCETGETLDPLEHCLSLHRHGALKIEDKALARVMQIVTFMARCDGEYHALERDAIDSVIGRYFLNHDGHQADFERASREAHRLAPSADDIRKALQWVKRAPERSRLARFITRSAAEVIDADGIHRLQETEWGIRLDEALKKLAVN